MGKRPDVDSDYYKIYTPMDVPLVFCTDGYYRLAAKAECKGCGQGFIQVLRCDRFRSEVGIELSTPKPDPNNELVMATFMVKVCEHGVGARKLHKKGCWVGEVKRTGKFELSGMMARRYSGGHRSAPQDGGVGIPVPAAPPPAPEAP